MRVYTQTPDASQRLQQLVVDQVQFEIKLVPSENRPMGWRILAIRRDAWWFMKPFSWQLVGWMGPPYQIETPMFAWAKYFAEIGQSHGFKVTYIGKFTDERWPL